MPLCPKVEKSQVGIWENGIFILSLPSELKIKHHEEKSKPQVPRLLLVR